MALRVLVADDHPMCRAAARMAMKAIDPDVETVEVAYLADALASDGRFDLILLDLNLLDSRGLSTFAAVVRVFPTSPILVISGSEDAGWESNLATLGVGGYVSKTATIPDITDAARTVLAGKRALRVIDVPPHLKSPSDAASKLASLTPAEHRVLNAMAGGGMNKQIAYELGLSEMTIKQHVRSILRKLQVINRTKAVILYRDQR